MNEKEVHICPILMRTVIWEEGKCPEDYDDEEGPLEEDNAQTNKEAVQTVIRKLLIRASIRECRYGQPRLVRSNHILYINHVAPSPSF